MNKKTKIEAVVFDIDGVIVDTRGSYLEAIRIATEIYLTQVVGFSKVGSPLLSLKEVELFKMLGGFNNDWDCVEGLLYYFLSLGFSKKEMSLKTLKSKKNFKALLKINNKRFLRFKKNKSLISYNLIVSIFQEIYLGNKIYPKIYKKKNSFWNKKGLYLKEKPLHPIDFYRQLKKNGLKLAIATGRARFETQMILRQLKLTSLFDSIVTADDVVKAEERFFKQTGKKQNLSKPNPFVLVRNAKNLKQVRFAYIGDLPDDIKTARRAARFGLSVKGIGFLKAVTEKSAMRQAMKRAGAHSVANTPQELIKILNSF